MQFLNQRTVGLTALAFAVASCAAPMAGVGPMGGPSPAAVASGAPTVSATPTPAPAAAPSLPPAPPMAKDARARLTGVVLFNDSPVTDASLTAVDLATGKAIALTPWSDTPQAMKLLSTQKTDAKGTFDFELPKLDEGQIVKLVATKGAQTFTALFNSRGQALGADTPSAATYQLQQGTAVSVAIRLRLSAATTAATQAFEGALKLTFQLPESISAERRSAVLEAARKAAQVVAEALAKNPEVAGRIVSSVNSEGAVTQLETFRTAVTNLGVFTELFRAVQGELLAVSVEKLTAPAGLDPIRARHFPLDDVVISPSGFLGFSGQKQPITLAGQVESNFVPSPARGGGGSQATTRPPRWVSLISELSGNLRGLAYLTKPVGGAQLAYVDGGNSVNFVALSGDTATASGTLTIPGLTSYISVTQAPTASGILYVSPSSGPAFSYYEPDTGASGSIYSMMAYAPFYALGADSSKVYLSSFSGPFVMRRNHENIGYGYDYVQLSTGAYWFPISPTAMAVHEPNDGSSSTIFVGTDGGNIFSAQEGGASTTLATGMGSIQGLAFATPTLYAASPNDEKIYAINVNNQATSVFVSGSNGYGEVKVDGGFIPYGLALDSHTTPTHLFIADRVTVLSGYRLMDPGPGPTGRILRVRLAE